MSASGGVYWELLTLADAQYREFNCKLLPTVDTETVIGVRMPQLRALAKTMAGTPQAAQFMACLPHSYHEENLLHGQLICRIKEFSACLEAVEAFLPYVDNWAVCDTLTPKALEKDRAALLVAIRRWLVAGEEYSVRYGVLCLMRLYLDDRFSPDDLAMVAQVSHDGYYVQMMVAWYFATALAKQWQASLPYIEQHLLPEAIHNKAIQKAMESRRIAPERKAYLRTLRRKGGGK